MPRPLDFGGKEGGEDLLEYLRRDAGAAIRHGDAHHIVGGAFRRDEQAAIAGRNVVHRVAAVHDEIEQHLLELDVVAMHRRESGQELRATATLRVASSLWTSRALARCRR